MNMKIVSKKENNLFKREEIEAEVDVAGATPSRKDITTEAAKVLGTEEGLLIIDRISNSPKKVSVKIQRYSKKEDIPKHKTEKIQKRLFGVSKQPAGAPAEKPA